MGFQNVRERKNFADNFEKEVIDGKILLSTTIQSIQAMEQLGLTMIGKKGKFLQTLKELTGKPIYLVEY